MNTDLAIHLSEHAFTSLSNDASAVGKTPAELAASVVENIYAAKRADAPDPRDAREQFEQCFGSVDLGRPIGIGNESIDADLAHGYGATHEST